MSDEVSLQDGWSLPAYIAYSEAMRVEMDKRLEQRFVAQEKAVHDAMTSAKEAVLKAEAASEERFKSVNEFRATLSDQATQFASAEKVNDLVSRFDRLEGRAGGVDANWTKIGGFVALGVGLLTILSAIIGVTLYLATASK